MTTITVNNETVTVNGRKVYDTIDVAKIQKDSSGVWSGETTWGDTFRIIGGSASGGSSNEWFLEFPMAFGDQSIKAKSAVECFKMMGRV